METASPPTSTSIRRPGCHAGVRSSRVKDHTAVLGVEHPDPPGRAPTAADRTLAADAARLVAGQPPEAVVAEEQVENAVVLGPADVRTARGGNELDDGHPPAGGRDHGGGP